MSARSMELRKSRLDRRAVLDAGQVALLFGALAVAAAFNDAADWRPVELVGALLALTIGGQALSIQVGTLRVSPAFLSMVLAMALLGPAPAVAIALAYGLFDGARARMKPRLLLNNLATFATITLVGGVAIEALHEPVAGAPVSVELAVVVLCVYVFTNFLNFTLIIGYHRLRDGGSYPKSFRELYLPVVPWELATGGLVTATVLVHQAAGVAAVGGLALLVYVFQHLLKAVVDGEQHRKALDERIERLAAMHEGLLRVLLDTLALHDEATSRHSAAVARFARETAEAMGLSTEEQDLAHTAGLLHDIGKFSFPERLHKATKLDEDDWQMIRRHPAIGAEIVGRVEGYEKVAEIVLHHHEKVDGSGYPDALRGEEIPLVSRIIGVVDAFDVMTARDSYRTPKSVDHALEELRRCAGSQFDPQVVQAFSTIIAGGISFTHADDADFEAELVLGRDRRRRHERHSVVAAA